MSAPIVRVTLWLAFALHVLAGLYWALLSTPESNALMLALSLVLIVVLLLGAGVALDVAVRLWTRGPIAVRRHELVLPALRLLPALAVFGAVWWVADAAGACGRGVARFDYRGDHRPHRVGRSRSGLHGRALAGDARRLGRRAAGGAGAVRRADPRRAGRRGAPLARPGPVVAGPGRRRAGGDRPRLVLAAPRGVAAGAAAHAYPTGVRRCQDRRRLDCLGAGDRQLHPARRARPRVAAGSAARSGHPASGGVIPSGPLASSPQRGMAKSPRATGCRRRVIVPRSTPRIDARLASIAQTRRGFDR